MGPFRVQLRSNWQARRRRAVNRPSKIGRGPRRGTKPAPRSSEYRERVQYNSVQIYYRRFTWTGDQSFG